MTIKPREGSDPDILDALQVLHCEASSTLRAAIINQAQREIISLRSQLAELKQAVQPGERHAEGCECADFWREMEGRA